MYNTNDIPDSSPPPRQGAGETWLILSLKTGKLEFQSGKDKPYQDHGPVKGLLLQTWLEWDHGYQGSGPKDSVPARFVLNARIQTKEGNKLIKGLGTDVPFISLCAALRTVPLGQIVYIEPRKSSEEGSVFFDVSFWDGENVHGIEIDEIWDKDKIAKEDRRSTVEKWLSQCPTYKEPVEVTHDKNGEAIRYYLSGSGSQPQQPKAPKPTAPVPDGKCAFGWVPNDWPTDDLKSRQPNEAQFGALIGKALDRGIDNKDQLSEVGALLLTELGLPRSLMPVWSMWQYKLVWLFVTTADQAAIDAAKARLKAEYDPFADE